MKRLYSIAALLATIAAIALAGFTAPADAAGGSYAFEGGTVAQQATVRNALRASLFPWSIVPRTITVHIVGGGDSYALPGHVWLDGDLLRSGRFSWGVVQHEFAHQVDFFLLDGQNRARFLDELGGTAWGNEVPGLAHEDYGSERFASTLAWAYWPSAENAMSPSSTGNESGAISPARFRALLVQLIGVPQPAFRALSAARR